MERKGMAWNDMVRNWISRHGMETKGMEWMTWQGKGMERHGMERQDMESEGKERHVKG
jgi:hypothetical protein